MCILSSKYLLGFFSNVTTEITADKNKIIDIISNMVFGPTFDEKKKQSSTITSKISNTLKQKAILNEL